MYFSDEISQDSVSQVKTENPFYQCPHCDDNFESFDDVTTHIEDEHDNNATENVVKCSECKKQLPRNHEAIKEHMRTEHMPHDEGKIFKNNQDFHFEVFSEIRDTIIGK